MSQPDLDDLRTRLRETMNTEGFTQMDVAKTTGLSQSFVSRFLRSRGTQPEPDAIKRIAAFLGDDDHTEVLSHEEVRKAVRLYRYIKSIIGSGSRLTVKNPDGTENIIVLLW